MKILVGIMNGAILVIQRNDIVLISMIYAIEFDKDGAKFIIFKKWIWKKSVFL